MSLITPDEADLEEEISQPKPGLAATLLLMLLILALLFTLFWPLLWQAIVNSHAPPTPTPLFLQEA